MISAEEGMQMDKSDEHSQNASSSICRSLEPLSNARPERAWHIWKHFARMTRTDEGMQTDAKTTSPSERYSKRMSVTDKASPPKETELRGKKEQESPV
jgi:hypothetical protein